MNALEIAQLARSIRENIQKVIISKEKEIELVLAALLCGGHILLEDVPGTAKPRWPKRLPGLWTGSSPACSSRQTCCPRT